MTRDHIQQYIDKGKRGLRCVLKDILCQSRIMDTTDHNMQLT